MTAISPGQNESNLPGRKIGLSTVLRNPIVLKELRGRMRGPRAFVVLTVYLLLMSAFATLLYYLYSASLNYQGYALGGTIGRWMFVSIVGIELLLVSFIAPTFTAGAISGERERQTYDLLRTTLLPARTLVVGKLISALAYVLLLLVAAIPLQSIAFMFGGVTESEIMLSFVILFVTSIALGALGIYASATMPRTLNASVVTYGIAVFLTLGLPTLLLLLGTLLAGIFRSTGSLSIPVQTAVIYIGTLLASSNPLTAAAGTEYYLTTNRGAAIIHWTLVSNSGTGTLLTLSPWITFTILYLLLSVFMVWLTIRRIDRIDAQ